MSSAKAVAIVGLTAGLVAAGAMVAGFASPWSIDVGAARGEAGALATGATWALAPLSLGHPAAATTLTTRLPASPAAPARAVQRPPITFPVEVRTGDTLAKLLQGAGVSGQEAHFAIAALKGVYDPRRIRPGEKVLVTFEATVDGTDSGLFVGFSLDVALERRVAVSRLDEGFAAEVLERDLERALLRSEGTIRSSLFVDGEAASVPVPVLVEIIRAYSWDVDFQRDIRDGDGFELVYERFSDEFGKPVHAGRLVSAKLTLSGKRLAIYRFAGKDGATDFYDDKGQSVRKALMRTPIDGARLSSRYGPRRHPILGYTKVHRGLDFAAPQGTPVYAAGNGTVRAAGRNGAYGNYVRIRHNERYSTAYAHLRGIAKGVRKGRRVTQGQVIGYVGSTGRSTGPHLHYEILVAARQVNPLSLKLPSGRKLEGAELERFRAEREVIERAYASLVADTEVASERE
ncbi:MAG: peptidoglycan DD-metalloendopeptidase family protein [Rhodospirillales bacterium]|jgi:murein DD-endopeptidase MepM/ murein hydrolase activator NlpD|nr:peptidoglycan DD-metalloendopeptidase family protein [Rhodospirillales bacterium]